jgi:hypothetical protein
MRSASLVAITTILVLLGGACGTRSPSKSSGVSGSNATKDTSVVEIGKPAPEFSRPALGGGDAIAVPGKEGKVSLVVFFATWSEPDMKLMTRLAAFDATYSKMLTIVGVGLDDDDHHLLEAARSRGARFPIVWDAGHSIATRYRLETDPTIVVLDRSGVVRFIHIGYRGDETEFEIDDEIMSLTSGDLCGSGSVYDASLCSHHCERAAKKHCDQRACRDACLHDNVPRNRAIAVCNHQERPKERLKCEATCKSDELRLALDTCLRQSKGDAALDAVCTEKCGLDSCMLRCRSRR